MDKRTRGIFFLWVFIAVLAAGGTFLIVEHLDAGTATQYAAAPATDTDVSEDVATSTPVALQSFADDGYTFSVPAIWNIERTGTDTIAIHPDAASPDAACKIEVSAFPYSPDTDMADWISHRIGADPSLSVSERSSADVSVNGGTGVQWTGTIDGIPTTLVYIFGSDHAYEIAPSVVGANDTVDSTSCGDMLQTLLSAFTL